MKLDVLNKDGEASHTIDVSSANFDASFNNALVHQVAVAYRAAGRAGTHAQKNRSRVRGGGAKPYRQKGIGRARAGTRSSPLFRGGGQIFAVSPRDYSQKVNRKSFQSAMRSVLSETLRRGRLVIVEDMNMDTVKTKHAVERLASLDCHSALIVDDNPSEALFLSIRNIPDVYLIDPTMLNPADLVDSKMVVMTQAAAKFVDEWLQ